MPTYDEIGNAFGSFCEASWKIRDQILAIATGLKVSIQRVGSIPPERFGFAPPSGHFDTLRTYGPTDAFKYNPEKNCWELCYFLDVRRGKDIIPAEILVFTVCLTRNPTGFELKLDYSEKYAATILESLNPDELEKLYEEISEGILNDVLNYYK